MANLTSVNSVNFSIITPTKSDLPGTILRNASHDPSQLVLEPWTMPREIFVVTMALLSSEILLSVLTNVVLIATIWHSPSLKTPPNAHLVNICVNNLVLCLSMLFSAASLLATGSTTSSPGLDFCSSMQVFLCMVCFTQYWSIFAAIGYYRSRTIKNPSMSLKIRRKFISRSIVASWAASLAVAVTLTSVFLGSTSSVSWNAFRRNINETEVDFMEAPTAGQSVVLYTILVLILIFSAVIFRAYYWIFRTLYSSRPTCKNRISPWARTNSTSSEENDVILSNRRSYRPEETVLARQPFTISTGFVADNFVVHYHKRDQSLTVEEVFALEYPMRANATYKAHRALQATLSTTSNASNKSAPRRIDFTDISPGAELQRLQKLKNTFALRHQSWRKDRVSLRSATKNSLAMISTFALCSFPLMVCSVPGVLPSASVHGLTSALLFCRLIFFLNAPAYPIWYLIFSKRVRKCLQRMYENALVRLNIRQ